MNKFDQPKLRKKETERYRISPGSEMNAIPQELKSELRLRNRILSRVNGAHINHFLDPKLDLLLGSLRRVLKQTFNQDTSASRHQLAQIRYSRIHDNLQIRRAGPVIHLQKCKRPFALFTTRFHPSSDSDSLSSQTSAAVCSGQDCPDSYPVWECVFFYFRTGRGIVQGCHCQ